jgi:hypothetical protein
MEQKSSTSCLLPAPVAVKGDQELQSPSGALWRGSGKNSEPDNQKGFWKTQNQLSALKGPKPRACAQGGNDAPGEEVPDWWSYHDKRSVQDRKVAGLTVSQISTHFFLMLKNNLIWDACSTLTNYIKSKSIICSDKKSGKLSKSLRKLYYRLFSYLKFRINKNWAISSLKI